MVGASSTADSPEFAEPVRQALLRARHEAVRLHHPYVSTEHVLLGLLRLHDPEVQRLWNTTTIDPDAIARTLEAALKPGDPKHAISDAAALPYTAVAKRTIEWMVREAAAEGYRRASLVHLLLAVVREERGVASRICRDAGVTPTHVRSVAREQPTGTEQLVLVELDDRADRSIREQIIGQIQERVATGVLEPGQRLPPVRRLADQLDVAPGTVAKAYAELERMGIVETDGARGTRVAERRAATEPDARAAAALVHQLRPVVITAFHLGISARQLRATLEQAMADIFDDGSAAMT